MIDLEVFVADEQGDVEIDAAAWAQFVRKVLIAEGSVLFVDETAMASLHERFLGLAGPTDVLSFPLDGEFVAASKSTTGPGGYPSSRENDDVEAAVGALPLSLGDIVVCPAVALRQAPAHAGNFDDEVALLLVHGTLHLLGHDHVEEAERAVMQGRERDLLAACWGALANDPWAAMEEATDEHV